MVTVVGVVVLLVLVLVFLQFLRFVRGLVKKLCVFFKTEYSLRWYMELAIVLVVVRWFVVFESLDKALLRRLSVYQPTASECESLWWWPVPKFRSSATSFLWSDRLCRAFEDDHSRARRNFF